MEKLNVKTYKNQRAFVGGSWSDCGEDDEKVKNDTCVVAQASSETLLPQIRAEIHEEFCTSSGPSDSGGNPPPQAKGGDAWLITVTWVEFKKLFFLQFFPRAEPECLKREYHSIFQTNTETSTEFMQRFLRLAGFLGAAAGTEEEQAKNFQWGLHKSTLNHLMCIPFTDVAQVANVSRNYEILHEREDDEAEQPDKRQKIGDRHQPTTQQSSHRNHGHNNDRHGSDRRGGSDNHRSRNNNYSGNNNRETRVSSPTDLPILVFSSPRVPLRATPTRFALRMDADTHESVVELLVPASSMVKLAICKRIARRTPLRVHLVRLIRSQ
nr:zinc finger, CCHC-type, retrotransposon Gag domain protein [Tanacetum cinerariifolium]